MKLLKYLSKIIREITFNFNINEIHKVTANVITVEGNGFICYSKGGTIYATERHWVHVWSLRCNKLVELKEYYDSIVSIMSLKSVPFPSLWTLWQSQNSKLYMCSFPSLLLII
ncbi:hypothetical protein KP509_30G023900 [Ceratopteris richardii]|nr:hypothetical protein KP509_30G023900 [Ceratopteris richardii]